MNRIQEAFTPIVMPSQTRMTILDQAGRARKQPAMQMVLRWTAICLSVLVLGGLFLLNRISKDTPSLPTAPTRDGGEQTVDSSQRKEGVVTVLLCGIDFSGNYADTVMVATLDEQQHTVEILSIPRDTQVMAAGVAGKVNDVSEADKVKTLQRSVEGLVGFMPDAYVLLDLNGFVRVVDALGGLDFDVPKRMVYRDKDQKLTIDLNVGIQHLDGAQALQMLRYRHYEEGDLRRIEVGQQFLTQMAQQLLQGKAVVRLEELVDIVFHSVQTDLTTDELLSLLQLFWQCDENGLKFHTLPGTAGVHYDNKVYYLADPQRTVRLVNDTVNPYLIPISASDLRIGQLSDSEQ